MTTATVAHASSTDSILLAIFLVISFATVVVYWNHERRMDRGEDELYEHAQQLATLDYRLASLCEYLGVEIPEPVVDDSPEALANGEQGDSAPSVIGPVSAGGDGEQAADTEEFDAVPDTVPDLMPLAVQTALIEAPTHKDVEWVERSVNIGGNVQTFRIRAPQRPTEMGQAS